MIIGVTPYGVLTLPPPGTFGGYDVAKTPDGAIKLDRSMEARRLKSLLRRSKGAWKLGD